ncbi:MAG: hypothetical protein HYY40_10980 [Bacteroidetes bacterium]|nr:hypothetical protein [Bacteroidota bacterium]
MAGRKRRAEAVKIMTYFAQNYREMWGKILGIAGLLLVSAVKFLFAPGSLRLSGFNYWETILISTAGGWMGVFLFYYLGGWALDFCGTAWRKLFNKKNKPQKIFTRRNRFIVKVKKRFGVKGIAFISPVTISIPVGCLVAERYYRHEKGTVRYFLVSVLFWSLVLSTLVHIFRFDIR